MSDEVVKGINDFTLTKQEKQWSKERGWYVRKTYQGPQAMADGVAAILIAANADTITIGTGVPCEIVADIPVTPSGYNEDVSATEGAIWELVGEPVERRLESHGKFNNSGSSQAILEMIEQALKDGTSSDTNWDSVYAGLGAFNAYRDLRLMGVDSYQAYTWRVRCVQTVSRLSLLKASFTNVGKIITWSDMKVPSSAKFSQPTIHMCKPFNSGSFSDESVNEWLVQPPSVRWQKGIRKWQISQEWIGAVSVSGTLYDGGQQTP